MMVKSRILGESLKNRTRTMHCRPELFLTYHGNADADSWRPGFRSEVSLRYCSPNKWNHSRQAVLGPICLLFCRSQRGDKGSIFQIDVCMDRCDASAISRCLAKSNAQKTQELRLSTHPAQLIVLFSEIIALQLDT